MTREEVAKWLKSLKKEIGKAENRTLWHYAESIDMAIEALQAEIDGNLINRKEAIREMCEMMVDCFNADEEVIDAIKTTVEEIPSATCDDCIWHVCNYNKVDWDADTVSKGVFDQVKWERDTALKTLEEHGIGLGERVEPKTGKWMLLEYEYLTCSECGDDHWTGCESTAEARERLKSGDYPNYCSNCGAKMNNSFYIGHTSRV